MKNILVILTGGTIGSQNTKNIIETNEKSAGSVVKLYTEKYGKDVTFDVITPFCILSENMTMDYWNKLIDLIRKNVRLYDGIIVAHGSDTLSYSSNIFGLIFENSPIPIVFMASNKPLEDESGNGLINFRNAVVFINTSGEKGVFVSYSNSIDCNTIYHSCNICEADNYFDNFRAYDGEMYGEIVSEKFVKRTDKNYLEKLTIPENFKLKKHAILIKPFPDINYDCFDLKNIDAVIHYLYHSSTACVSGNENSVLNLIDKCKKENKRFFIAPVKKSQLSVYSSLNSIIKNEFVETIYDCSIEKAYATALIKINE